MNIYFTIFTKMVNREAQELTEALRLQKLRAALYLLNHIEKSNGDDFRVAIELKEDVYIAETDTESFEQNKNYDSKSTFSINSTEVLKSLCSFLDIWFENEFSAKIAFCFLSTNKIAQDSASSRSKRLGITFPSEKILNELSSGDILRIKNVVEIVKSIIIDFYKENHGAEINMIKYLEELSDDLWIDFLTQIKWIFDYPSVDELDNEVSDNIKNSKYYSSIYNEETCVSIKSSLLDLVETRSYQLGKTFRLVSPSDIKLIFSQQASIQNSNLESDEVHKLWENIDVPDDVRNFSEKVLAVCPDFDVKRLSLYERKVAMAKVEEERLKNETQYLALKYRVFDFCDHKLFGVISSLKDKAIPEEKLVEIIEKINQECTEEFKQLKRQYNYGIDRNSVVLELFLEFVDSCYLAFD